MSSIFISVSGLALTQRAVSARETTCSSPTGATQSIKVVFRRHEKYRCEKDRILPPVDSSMTEAGAQSSVNLHSAVATLNDQEN